MPSNGFGGDESDDVTDADADRRHGAEPLEHDVPADAHVVTSVERLGRHHADCAEALPSHRRIPNRHNLSPSTTTMPWPIEQRVDRRGGRFRATDHPQTRAVFGGTTNRWFSSGFEKSSLTAMSPATVLRPIC